MSIRILLSLLAALSTALLAAGCANPPPTEEQAEQRCQSWRNYARSKSADHDAEDEKTGVPRKFLEHLCDIFEQNFFAFLEINPLIVRGEDVHLLDAAVLVDSTAEFFVKNAWSASDTVTSKASHPSEQAVEKLAATTPAALSLKVLNKDGALFFLLSGGGGSIVIADEVANGYPSFKLSRRG